MNKTAMQQLREEVKKEYELSKRISLAWLMNKITELEATEKQMIIDAYCEPYNYENHLPADLLDSAEQYYNQTFGQ